LAETRRFWELGVVAYARPQGVGKMTLELLEDLGALPYPPVAEGRDYAAYPQAYPVALDLIYAAEEVAYALQRQRFHGDRYQELVDVEQAIDIEDVTKRWCK